MLRGTVYVVDAEGTPVFKMIVGLTSVNDALEFRHTASRYHEAQGDIPPGGRVEFGPISEPWNK